MTKPDDNVELQANIYSKKLNFENENLFGSLIAKYLTKKYRKIIQTPILDAGSGTGDLIQTLQKKYPENKNLIFGIDLAPNEDANIIAGDLKQMPFKDNEFGTIFCTEVLEHLDDETLYGTLHQFHRVLNENGKIIATFPFDEDVKKSIITCPYCDKSFHKYGHVRSWHSKKEIMETFTKANLKIESIDILPLGAIAKIPMLRICKPILNKLNNPPGLRKRAVVIASK